MSAHRVLNSACPWCILLLHTVFDYQGSLHLVSSLQRIGDPGEAAGRQTTEHDSIGQLSRGNTRHFLEENSGTMWTPRIARDSGHNVVLRPFRSLIIGEKEAVNGWVAKRA